MGDRLSLVWGGAVGAGATVIALDYRSVGLRVYDLIAQRSPGDGVDPRFSPDIMRGIFGVLGVVFLSATGMSAFGMF
ncbi:hypothetical protein [Streptomyces longhuiensis]|uniref:hypothetical protein n=1 Tax=Streptomyces longhuiensis TaxID=2880933 RepID=UPI001D0AA754|nr:hypothetical protein [Streptomyces longhuiensis]UDM05505.1 hypothetical protein LGI35_45490 [Streptomyces longhuiensis]